jgi:hypothetical protein
MAILRHVPIHLLTSNISIDNPLKSQSKEQTAGSARAFHHRHDLKEIVDVETFVRAVLAARDPDEEAYVDIDGLTYIERKALIDERSQGFLQQFKHLSKDFRIVLATCCCGAITQ